jgi:ketosteroid isomerase-like protein
MSAENIALVRRFLVELNAFMRDELSSQVVAEAFDPQIEMSWHDEQTYPDVPQHLEGAEKVTEFIERYRGQWADSVQEALEVIAAPSDRVLALIRQSGRGRQSGVPIVIHFFEIFTLRDGKVRRFEYFRHRSDAMEAAGLSA